MIISGGAPRRPDRPSRWRKPETVYGASTLNDPLQSADIDTELHCNRCTGHQPSLFLLHALLRLFPYRCGQISVVNEKNIRFAAPLRNLPQRGRNIFRFLP